MTDTLFIQPKDIFSLTALHSNTDSKMLTIEIRATQDLYILPLLGTALYERLQTGIENDNLTADEEKLLNTYILPCHVNYVMSELPNSLTYQIWNKGVTKKTSDNTESVSDSDISDIQFKYKNRAESYGQRLIKFLIEESGQNKYPEYINPGSRADTIIPTRNDFEVGIYLGNRPKKEGKNPQEYITDCE